MLSLVETVFAASLWAEATSCLCYNRHFCLTLTKSTFHPFQLLPLATLVLYQDHKSPNKLSPRYQRGISLGDTKELRITVS